MPSAGEILSDPRRLFGCVCGPQRFEEGEGALSFQLQEGTDIQEGKCSWVVLTVFSMCSEEHREVLKQNYGKNDRECVNRVKAVMSAYDVQSAYHACEAETLQTVNTLIREIPDKRIVPVLQLLSDKLLKG